VQISAWADEAAELEKLSDLVRTIFDRLPRQTFTVTGFPGVSIETTWIEDVRDEYDEYRRLHRLNVDVMIWYHDN
jgi:hypothetical protein